MPENDLSKIWKALYLKAFIKIFFCQCVSPKLFDIGKSLETNLQNTLKILLVPVILDIGGAFFLGFNMMNAVIINQAGLIFALGNTKVTHISKPGN